MPLMRDASLSFSGSREWQGSATLRALQAAFRSLVRTCLSTTRGTRTQGRLLVRRIAHDGALHR